MGVITANNSTPLKRGDRNVARVCVHVQHRKFTKPVFNRVHVTNPPKGIYNAP